jgi:hypothetical protein
MNIVHLPVTLKKGFWAAQDSSSGREVGAAPVGFPSGNVGVQQEEPGSSATVCVCFSLHLSTSATFCVLCLFPDTMEIQECRQT